MHRATLMAETVLLAFGATGAGYAQTTGGCTDAQRAGESNDPARGQPAAAAPC